MSIKSIDLRTLDGKKGFVLRGIDRFDFSGISVRSAGDVNNDGIEDLIIGRDAFLPNGNRPKGQSYVLFGRERGRPSATFALKDLNGTNGFTLNGLSASDRAGRSVNFAGDINGDGVDDLVIGSPGLNQSAGAVYVVYGADGLGQEGNFELSEVDGFSGFQLVGFGANSQAGTSVSSAGDVNNDGFDDLIIGAPGEGNSSGASYIVFGGTSLGIDGTLDLSVLDGTNGFKIEGEAEGDIFGFSVSKAGDVNNDGIDDILVGAPQASLDDPLREQELAGRSYLIFGSENIGATGSLDLDGLSDRDEGITFIGRKARDRWGTDVRDAGDVNGDGIADFILGSPTRSPAVDGQVLIGGGQATVIFGSDDPNVLDDNLRGPNALRIKGLAEGDNLGVSVSGAGDFNGDGIDDLLIGANRAGETGQAYVVFGHTELRDSEIDLNDIDGSNGIVLNGLNPEDGFATVLSSAGDLNHDGLSDIIVSSINATNAAGKQSAGESYVIFGFEDTGREATRDWDVIKGTLESDRIHALAGDDEVSGLDGDDTLLGGNGHDLLMGGFDHDVLRGGADNDTLQGGEGNDRLLGQNGDDLLEGGAGNDTLKAGTGNNILSGGLGDDWLVSSNGSDTLTGGEGNDEFLLRRLGTDLVTDFSDGDEIQVGVANFGAGLVQGELLESQLTLGVNSSSESTRFIFDADSGRLWFDGDGSGQQRNKLLVAQFEGQVTLSHEDFEVV